jgi:3-phosphoshikimate 1-carboxyvinyltransferase
VIRRAARLRGEVRVPGDKSISHRALMLNAIAEGEAVISNLGPGADCSSTLNCLRAMGVDAARLEDGSIRIIGAGLRGLREPENVLDAGNSGTTTRLLTGLLAGQEFTSVITGDESLRARPMRRVIEPLRRMGAQLWARKGDTLLPISIRGASLTGIDYALPVASAQLKSAILLAGLYAEGPTVVREPQHSRDHTERMLRAQGAELSVEGRTITVRSGRPLSALSIDVPGDISSAAFWLVAAIIHPDAEVIVRDVGVNPGRTGILEALKLMGADIDVTLVGERAGEPVADIVARSSALHPAHIAGDLIPRLIDEIPVLAVAAAFAEGETTFADASELRVKETDRVSAVVTELTRLGVDVRELPDGLIVRGGKRLRGAMCQSYGDHRMAMALAVAGLVADGETVVEGAQVADVSYPAFWEELERISSGGGL